MRWNLIQALHRSHLNVDSFPVGKMQKSEAIYPRRNQGLAVAGSKVSRKIHHFLLIQGSW